MNSEYSITKIGSFSFGVILLSLLLVLSIVYSGDVNQIWKGFIFCVLSIIILVPFLIFPIVNFALLFVIDEFQIFLLKLSELSGDYFTSLIVSIIAIFYIVLNSIVVICTMLFITGVKIKILQKIIESFSLKK